MEMFLMSEQTLYLAESAHALSLQGYLAHQNQAPMGPHSRPMPRVLGGSQGGGRFLMGELSL